ncbi:MAG: hypothetical protein K8R36_09730 [Planctomycetales bacterium]|nr:hypothetical protein [Planctomycetales bacterium]
MPDEGDQIDDDEFLHRRIPVKTNWYDPQKGPKPVQEAFKPHRENDPDGLSLSRAKSPRNPTFLDAESCAKIGPSPYGYYIALLRVRDLRAHNIHIVASPIPDSDAGHVHLPQLKSSNRDSNEVKSLAKRLADELTIEVLGPFQSSSGQPT